MQNKKSIKAVLGNHDFYLLYLIENKKNNKSLKQVLKSKDIKKISNLVKKPAFTPRN